MTNQNLLIKTAVCLFTFLLFTACTVSEARPTIIPIVLTPTLEATAVSPTAIIPSEITSTPSPIPTLPEPTAVPPRFITPTPTPTPVFPQLPLENSVTFTMQDQFGGVPSAVLVDGNVAYLAVGPRLVAVDVTDPSSPQFLSQSPILADVVQDIVQEETLIYGAAGRAGLVVLDVADPANIKIVSEGSNYSGATQPNANQIAISGERLFVSNYEPDTRQYDLHWFDLANPGQPTFLGTRPLDGDRGFDAAGDLLFFASESGIQVANAQNPMQEISKVGAEKEVHWLETAVEENLLYLLYYAQGLHFTIYDMANPASPQVVPQSLPVSIDFLGETAVTNNTLALTSTFGEFGYCSTTITILDITQAEAPQQTAEFNPQNCLTDLAGSGEFLYLAGRSGLQIYSTNDPANPQLMGSYTNPGGFQAVHDFLPGQPTSYILTSEGRGSIITSVDLSQSEPTLSSQTEPLPGNELLQLFALDQTLIAPIWNQGLRTFATSSSGQLQPLYTPDENDTGLGVMNTTVVLDNVVYLPAQDPDTGLGGLGVYDLHDPANPQLVKSLDIKLFGPREIVRSGNTLYVLGQAEQPSIAIIDISTPLEPALVSTIALPEAASQLAVVGTTLYATCDGRDCNSLTVVDATDLERPLIASQWQLPIGLMATISQGNTIYLLSHDNVIWAMDTSSPLQPKLVGTIHLPGRFARLRASDNTLYAASGAGLIVLTVNP